MLRLTEPTVAAQALRRYHSELLLVEQFNHEQQQALSQQHPQERELQRRRMPALPPARLVVTSRQQTLSSLPSRQPTASSHTSGTHTLASLNKPLPPLPRAAKLTSTHMQRWPTRTNVPVSEPAFRASSTDMGEYYNKLQQGPTGRMRRMAREELSWKARVKRAGRKMKVTMMLCGGE